ncbi:glycoside hydrolase family 1 protein [Yinghuangia sp. YIM S09857]|uniref:glycoside hydrolase family 1 protein n=1 Tax=Yinghuangia sp. YIM S09857 TaxID=3436929 RepID=UPI003F5371E6
MAASPDHPQVLPAEFHARPGFLFGASTSAHQTEGNNTSSDWWGLERTAGGGGFLEAPSGDAVDSFHRWPQDMDLLAELGFNSYRFGIEWARVEPEQGRVSRAAVEHYRAMVRGARERGLTPVVTLHHFTSPHWFTARGGWLAPDSAELFARYAETALDILDGRVEYVATINEPNMIALMATIVRGLVGGDGPAADRLDADRLDGGREGVAATAATVVPDAAVTEALIRAHRSATAVLKAADPGLRVGWTVANQVYQPEPGAEAVATAHAWPREDVFLDAARGDDWVGVQSYTRTRIGPDGPLPVPDEAERTITGWEFYPEAVGHAVRHTASVVGPDVPILVTENGIATADDERRVAYTTGALEALAETMRDGIDVRGYLHWSAVDNYEWGSYTPTFGLIAVDRDTFARTAKPSARWLGALARELRPATAPTAH